ncbi:MAG: DUF58 domain-containing protein [Acidimicrobiia bacterium]|nr:DUF58 domain-containing protein [Acidimicrobiia bacterium]
MPDRPPLAGGPLAGGPRPSGDPLTAVDSTTREVLRRLELEVTRRLDGLLHGDHRGLVPGHGSELGETRRYAPGDDVRRIDWNVTARLQEPYIRQTIAERELQTWLVIDRSSRMDFGTVNCEKRDVALAAAAAVGFLTARDGNQLGAVLAGRGAPTLIGARGSRKHLLRILHDLVETPRSDDSGITDLGLALGRLAGVARRRGLVAVISDFGVSPGWQDRLAVTARRHDVLAIQISDPRDGELPNVGVITVRDPATGQLRELATHKASVREEYAKAVESRQNLLDATFREIRVDHLQLSTGRAWLDDLVEFVVHRQMMLAHRRGGTGAPTGTKGGR